MTRFVQATLGAIFLLVGATLSIGGIYLLLLGGSPYYVVMGAGCVFAAIFLLRGKAAGTLIYLAMFLFTLIWSVCEVHLDFWQLLPRTAGPLFFMACCCLPWATRGLSRVACSANLLGVLAGAMVLGIGWTGGQPSLPDRAIASATAPTSAVARDDDWLAFGRTSTGTRYSPNAQITPENVGKLQVAWTYRTGDWRGTHPDTKGYIAFETTPLKVGNTLYLCTPHAIVVALDADTGRQRWRFDPKIDDTGMQTLDCRGVSYHRSASTGSECAERILVGTGDARLIALDARTGRLCPSFGNNGQVSLPAAGLGSVAHGSYFPTSPAVIVGDVAILGGLVRDNETTGEPSGVVRGFDVHSGKMLWGWDSGRADDAAPLKPGETYTRGSPNAWGVLSADPVLGLVYVPTGNATPDFVSMHRTPLMERYASSVVALDILTGRIRWSYQTTHHDIWDYDVAAQPVLFDMPGANGVTPAVAIPTKRGEIFILNRRNGHPIVPVVEKRVPHGSLPGERYAVTQPYSTFPSLAPPPLRERDMWGMTPIDQMMCRIRFRSLDYSGDFTPPSVRGSIQYPNNLGAIGWGSVAIDEGRHILVANSQALPMSVRLVPRNLVDGVEVSRKPEAGLNLQKGTPFAAVLSVMLSPMGIPCNAPPWGRLTAIDLQTQKIMWQRPLGTTSDTAPLGIAVPGVFNVGPSAVTSSGLVFIAATMDAYLRAFDIASGKELWRGRLPAAGQAGPMTYTSSKTGRQYVVQAAGGHEVLQTRTGDYIVAYALPQRSK